MKLLPDTHLLLWSVENPALLSAKATNLMGDLDNEMFFSAASIWEVAIKTSKGHPDFHVNPAALQAQLVANGYEELPVTGRHAVAVAGLAPIHKDPFDRLLVAQAAVEGITLLTADPIVARYPGPVRQV